MENKILQKLTMVGIILISDNEGDEKEEEQILSTINEEMKINLLWQKACNNDDNDDEN